MGARSAKDPTARCQSVRLLLHRGVNVLPVSRKTEVQTKAAIAQGGAHGQRGDVVRKDRSGAARAP